MENVSGIVMLVERYSLWRKKVIDDMDSLDDDWEEKNPLLVRYLNMSLQENERYRKFHDARLFAPMETPEKVEEEFILFFSALTAEAMKKNRQDFEDASDGILKWLNSIRQMSKR